MEKNDKSFTARFDASLARLFYGKGFPEKIAVAVSGGADSMALCYALSDYVRSYAPKTQILALSVDHRLREEAADEARFVGEAVGKLPNVSHHILVWEHGDQQDTRIEEKAREARYGLLFDFMGKNDVDHLFIGHHQNDQAETFLFRLAKGSGLDGLACMPGVSEVAHRGRNFTLCRPFLGEPKAKILEYTSQKGVSFIDDPSNKDEQFARVRLRQSMAILEKEGLSPKRLFVTASRIKRAREALEYISDKEYKNSLKSSNMEVIVFNYNMLADLPLEIVIRVILKAMEELNGESKPYGPRLERVENLCEDLVTSAGFRKRTLGGVVFEYDTKINEFILSREK